MPKVERLTAQELDDWKRKVPPKGAVRLQSPHGPYHTAGLEETASDGKRVTVEPEPLPPPIKDPREVIKRVMENNILPWLREAQGDLYMARVKMLRAMAAPHIQHLTDAQAAETLKNAEGHHLAELRARAAVEKYFREQGS